MARIGLIDVDGHNFPNLPLMKLSAWHKQQGDLVEWYMPFGERYDVVYMSKVFSFTPDYDLAVNSDKVVRGGTGYCIRLEHGREVFDAALDHNLPDEIEHTYPDYSIYQRLTQDTAYGFLTRGCPRCCDFCIVAKKEGRCSVKVADLSEFWKGQKKIVLCDPNILACKDWRDLLQQLISTKAWVDFNQGLDIRLMDEEKARLISQIKFKDIHFAWDRYEDMDEILPRLEMFAEIAKISPHGHHAIVYTLTNYNTTIEQDLDRIYTLRDMGYWPYVMIYDKEHCHDVYRNLQGWVNNRIIFATVNNFDEYRVSHK
ncbi:MAG: radical SAM protein [Bacteroidales bacterium]|nr:radical SAM protein [Bacteroidales bacterium]